MRREQKQVGGLAKATCEALYTCGSKNGRSPVNASRWRTRSRRPFEATQRRQRGEEVLYSRHRRQLALEGGSRAGGECLQKCIRQRLSEPGCDRSRETGAVLAEAQRDCLVDRRRKIDRDQSFGENAGEDQFAVDQDTIAIEDNQTGHGGLSPGAAVLQRI
jgi:hypothetical protein